MLLDGFSNDWLRRGMRSFDAGVSLVIALLMLWRIPGLENTDGIEYPLLIIAGSLLLPVCGELLGLYQPWRGRSLYTMLGVYVISVLLAITLLNFLLIATQSTQVFSRLWLGATALGVLLTGITLRSILYGYLRRLRARGRNLKRVLLAGSAGNVTRLQRRVEEMPYLGYTISHVFHDSHEDEARLQELIGASAYPRSFDEVWLAYPLAEGGKVRRMAQWLMEVPAGVRYFPDLSDVRLLNHRMTQVAGLYSLELNYTPLQGPQRLVKLLEDRLLGAVLFALFLPVMLFIAGLVRLKMGGPVLFKQERHGLDGKCFRIYKFRTMVDHDPGSVTHQACHGDPRITPLGAFLRRTSLDELPQLYNVLQGRMSLVGPRPHAMDHNLYYKDHIDTYMQRHRVKPGITGWAQVHGFRGSTKTLTEMQKRVEYDLYYIDNWSFGLDLRILAMTVTRGFINRQP